MYHKISIIIPVYNVERYVAKCLNSVLNQTYKSLEVIIVNDGSTDKSGYICDYYAKKDRRVILINQENQGLSMARNNAIDIATGSYIGFVDSDDWIRPDMIFNLYNNALKYNADISECGVLFVNENEPQDINRKNFDMNENNIIILEKKFDKMAYYIYKSSPYVWNKLFKKNLFNNIRFPQGKVYEDVFTTHKLVDLANRIVKSSQTGYYYLQRSNSLTHNQFNLGQMGLVEAHIEKYEYIKKRYPNTHLEKTCQKLIFTSLIHLLNKAYLDNRVDIYINEIGKIINLVRNYRFDDCGLSYAEMDTVKLILSNIRAYVSNRKAREFYEKNNIINR